MSKAPSGPSIFLPTLSSIGAGLSMYYATRTHVPAIDAIGFAAVTLALMLKLDAMKGGAK